MRPRSVADDLGILLVAVIWGSSYVVMQDVGRSLPAAPFLMLRFLCSLPPMATLAAQSLRRLTRNEILTGAFFGCLLYGVLIQEMIGVRYTSAANAGFLMTVSVLLIPPLERVISRRRQMAVVYVMMVTALVGCGMLLLSNGLRPNVGDFIILGAAAVRATQLTLFGRRPSGQDQSLINLSLVEFLVVTVLAGITALASNAPPWHAAASVSPRNWLLIAYLGVLGTAFAWFAQLRGARAASSTRVGLILSTEPLFATAFAVLAAGNRLDVLQILGGLLIVVSAAVGRVFEGRWAAPAPRVARVAALMAPARADSAQPRPG
ncbi:MAG TPA: DMT family transporter [Streptosporangiaceae bacterium]|nr:DMT family transporter [Streptosporangiaceae bacterium]